MYRFAGMLKLTDCIYTFVSHYVHVHLLLRWLDRWRSLITRWKLLLLGELWALFRQRKYRRQQGLAGRAKAECWELAASAGRHRAASQSRVCYQSATGVANSKDLPTRTQGAGLELLLSVLIMIPSDHSYSKCFLKSQTLIFLLNLSIIWKATIAEVCRHSNTELFCCPAN